MTAEPAWNRRRKNGLSIRCPKFPNPFCKNFEHPAGSGRLPILVPNDLPNSQARPMKINEFLDDLDSLTSPIPLDRIMQGMRQLEFELADVADHLRFDNLNYRRNLLHRGSGYEALILCFLAGQRTPIHDHCGSACGVYVLQGQALETAFAGTEDGWMYPTGSVELSAGGVTGSNDMDVHQLSNLQAHGKRLVTLHVYSPPLGTVGNYSLCDNKVTLVSAPVHEKYVRLENS